MRISPACHSGTYAELHVGWALLLGMRKKAALALLALEKLEAPWWCGRCYISSLWSREDGRIIRVRNVKKLQRQRDSEDIGQGAVVYLLWSLKSKARDAAAEEPVFEESYLLSWTVENWSFGNKESLNLGMSARGCILKKGALQDFILRDPKKKSLWYCGQQDILLVCLMILYIV